MSSLLGVDTLSLLNHAYWLLRTLEGNRHRPGATTDKMDSIWEDITELLNELDKQRWTVGELS